MPNGKDDEDKTSEEKKLTFKKPESIGTMPKPVDEYRNQEIKKTGFVYNYVYIIDEDGSEYYKEMIMGKKKEIAKSEKWCGKSYYVLTEHLSGGCTTKTCPVPDAEKFYKKIKEELMKKAEEIENNCKKCAGCVTNIQLQYVNLSCEPVTCDMSEEQDGSKIEKGFYQKLFVILRVNCIEL